MSAAAGMSSGSSERPSDSNARTDPTLTAYVPRMVSGLLYCAAPQSVRIRTATSGRRRAVHHVTDSQKPSPRIRSRSAVSYRVIQNVTTFEGPIRELARANIAEHPVACRGAHALSARVPSDAAGRKRVVWSIGSGLRTRACGDGAPRLRLQRTTVARRRRAGRWGCRTEGAAGRRSSNAGRRGMCQREAHGGAGRIDRRARLSDDYSSPGGLSDPI
ncbi:hypothetical protein EDB92DRAFT_331627 [Lactarius akahatsu]|uniref:Uncharacterized protein n=1 Tax=Lactarius akahatsu TaxID=416441 RepID=A0AAD4Q5H8_9AGAM|nr:hypothetical protein EDB92DRAFT_331627 [Lactarius akahatsu]